MPKLNIARMPRFDHSAYPEPYFSGLGDDTHVQVGRFARLTQFGARLFTISPGRMSTYRHWHEREDEFAVVMSGVLTLVEEDGEAEMRTGDCAAFPANVPNAHHFVNRSDEVAQVLVFGTTHPEEVARYPDINIVGRAAANPPAYTVDDPDAQFRRDENDG